MTWERGLFFRQWSAWRVVVLVGRFLLAGFGFSLVKTENAFLQTAEQPPSFHGNLLKRRTIPRNAQGRFWIWQRDDPTQASSLSTASQILTGDNRCICCFRRRFHKNILK
jgi:hypothetical protein